MSDHIFKRQQQLHIRIDQAWNFFSDPKNLCRITPEFLDFKIVSEIPPKIREGLEIEYKVRPVLGIPMVWVSRIEGIRPPFEFIDVQLKGPYSYWHHRHVFEEIPGGVLMTDIITYRVPLNSVFPWLNDLIVLKQLNAIFDFRQRTLQGLFGV